MDNQKTKKILLVEDEFYIRDLYKGILETAGLVVDVAADGKEGYTKAMEKPSLILLDIMLPALNGLELLKLLKANPVTQNIPVVLITNLGQQDVIQEAFNEGAQGYLLKVNLEAHQLIAEVNKYLANPNFRTDIKSLVFD